MNVPDTPALRRVAAARDVGALYKSLKRYGWTQDRIADATGETVSA